MRRVFALTMVVIATAAAVWWWMPPRERYAWTLRVQRLGGSDVDRSWSAAGERAVATSERQRVPFIVEDEFDDRTRAAAWRFPVRRGQRVTAYLVFGNTPAFLDLFDADGHAFLAGASSLLVYDVDRDGELTLRVQPGVDGRGRFRVSLQSRASMLLPIRGIDPRRLPSRFGDPRDAGRRRHEGIDIFASRGTPVHAVAEGWVTGSTHNRLGGNVVWVWSPLRRLRTYYAHLERQAVVPGEHVHPGDVVGYVGNTGNARTTAPHLHFGVYAALGGAVDPLPFICNAPCGERRLRPQRF